MTSTISANVADLASSLFRVRSKLEKLGHAVAQNTATVAEHKRYIAIAKSLGVSVGTLDGHFNVPAANRAAARNDGIVAPRGRPLHDAATFAAAWPLSAPQAHADEQPVETPIKLALPAEKSLPSEATLAPYVMVQLELRIGDRTVLRQMQAVLSAAELERAHTMLDLLYLSKVD